MWFISALAPIVIVGGIVVFVMKRMERQYKEETLERKIKRSSKLIRHFHTYRNACRLCNWFDFRHVFPRFLTTFN